MGHSVTTSAKTGLWDVVYLTRSVPHDEVKKKAVGDQSKLTVKITVMVMIFPDGGYNQGSHFVDILYNAKHTHTHTHTKVHD